ncbi:MAG: hypothetical protein LUD47_02610 [Clostridia bacterium]|nr:hypothetical protein [Clostridia bacterium]
MWFISWEITIECIVTAIALAVGLFFVAKNAFAALQYEGYRDGKLFAWSAKRHNLIWHRLTLLMLCCGASAAVLALCFSFAGNYAAVVSLAGFVVFFILYGISDKRSAMSCNVTPSARLTRLEYTSFIVFAIVSYIVLTLLNFAAYVYDNEIFSMLRYVPLAVMPLLVFPMTTLADVIIKIYEAPHAKRERKRAERALLGKDVKIVYIYGTHGTCTLTGIIEGMLSGTSYGVKRRLHCKNRLDAVDFVNDADVRDGDVLVMEIEATSAKDLDDIVTLCPPAYTAIVDVRPIEEQTGLEGILFRATKKKIYFCMSSRRYSCDVSCETKVCDGFSDVSQSEKGINFNLKTDGGEKKVFAVLHGAKNAEYIAAAAALALDLGVSEKDIPGAIAALSPAKHCLSVENVRGVNVLDYGACTTLQGVDYALEALGAFPGKKVVVTKGIIRAGILGVRENMNLGRALASADRVLLVGRTQVTCVYDAYKKERVTRGSGGAEALEDDRDIYLSFTKAMEHAGGTLDEGDTVLILNEFKDMEKGLAFVGGKKE